MTRYSILSLARNALSRHAHWPRAWRSPQPRQAYEVVVVGGGGHGLATAYYLAREHGIRDVAVLEKGWLGGGNTGRNTTIIRSNYYLQPNARFYDFSLRLWERLSEELNYNVMFSPRGVLNLAHGPADLDAYARRGNAMRCHGIDARILTRDEVAAMVPALDVSPQARFPVAGGLLQARGGTARHDALAWAYARAADRLGVDIIQNCEVTGFAGDGATLSAVHTTRGTIRARRIGLAVAGHSGQVAALAGLRLPIESHVLQALVSEPIKPILDTVVTSGAAHFYLNQTDKGELVAGGDLDGYNSYGQRSNLPAIEHVVQSMLALFPRFARLRMLRTWAGVMDMSMDGSPIIGTSPLRNLYLNCGWCYGGFKATPASGWTFAHTIATGQPHPLNAPYSLDRFASGHTIDEKGAGPFPWMH